MQRTTCFNPVFWLVCLLLMCGPLFAVHAGDLPVVSDGRHVWMLEPAPPAEGETDAGPTLVLYHLPADREDFAATKLKPIAGELMRRGLAAGGGQVLMVTKGRQLITVRPVWSELQQGWGYAQRSLAALPEGCTLLSLAMGDHGPWALVRVQSKELLDRLDHQQAERDQPSTDQQLLNRALGLPEGYTFDPPTKADDASDAGADTESDTQTPDSPEQTPEPTAEPDASALEEQPPTQLPAYRLIYLRNSKWASSPLPDGFEVPREAALVIRPGDKRPTLLVDSDVPAVRGPTLVRYTPADAQWRRQVTSLPLPPGRRWSAAAVDGQFVVAIERFYPQAVVTVDGHRLRGDKAYAIGAVNLPVGDHARWTLFAKGDDLGIIASPVHGPSNDASKPADAPPALAIFGGLDLSGQALFVDDAGQPVALHLTEKQPNAFDGNADLFIQILVVIAAMLVMILFYRPAAHQMQVDLPEHLVLASFGRRMLAGVIDLAPGFLLVGLIYDLSIGETVFNAWPGIGPQKAFVVMRPGLLVIAITLLHATVMEFIFARSLGKMLMGLYVTDLAGKRPTSLVCLGRSLSRAFELAAPFILLIAVISPARQRLGDLLCKTTVVMDKPQEPDVSDDA